MIQYGAHIHPCAIGVAGDSDLFRFQGTAGHVVSVMVVDQAGGFSNPGCGLELIRPTGTTVAAVVNAYRCEIRATLDATGLFIARVTENQNDGTMNYSLQLERLSPFSTGATPLDPGDTVIGARIDPIGDMDLYVFQGTSGDAVSVRVTDQAGAFSEPGCWLELFRPDGTSVAVVVNAVSCVINATLDQTGGFTVRVGENQSDNVMTYNLEYQCLSGNCPIDSDGDGLRDDWETRFGLDPTSGAGDNGGAGDPDADGATNLDEYQQGTHPRGFFKRYLAEGALNTFFDTRLALLNVGAQEGRVLLRFLQPGGITLPRFELLPALRRRTIVRQDLAGLVSPDFSTVVESDQPVVLDRTMSWDATGYGSHAESSVASPSTTWYLAEGSTSAEFALFYLLQNPNPTGTIATVRYLLPFGQAPIERQYALTPNSRTTIPVDAEGPQLASTDVSAVVSAPQPIIVERAMYMTRFGQPFGAGHGSAGVVAPAATWFLAEGATGPFFDLFILLANPNAQAAQVTIDYLLLGGTTYSKSYSVAANSRSTIWVDDEQVPAGSGVKPFDNVAVSSTVTSTNGVPIIVERTMWWPSPALGAVYWTEAHNSPGATTTAVRWALAEGEVGGPQTAETYILIANTSASAGSARVRLHFEGGTTAERTLSLAARSRTTVGVSTAFPEAAGQRFGAIVESLGATPAQIVVERAMYTSPGGATWAAGTNALGTPLP